MKENEIIYSKKTNTHMRGDNLCELLDSAVNNIYSCDSVNTMFWFKGKF